MSGTTPTQFTFIDLTNVQPNISIESNPVTILDIGPATPISIIGGEYSINGGAYTTVDGTVDASQTVTVKITSSTNYQVTSDVMLTVGDISDIFSVTTRANDVTPDTFTFTALSNLSLASSVTSANVTITGMDNSTPISIVGGEYSINGGTFTATSGIINTNDNLKLKLTTSFLFNTSTSTTVTIGNGSGTFSARTLLEDTTPDTFTFTAVTDTIPSTQYTSNDITVSGINSNAAISVTGGSYSIGAGAFTTTAGTVINGQVVRVKGLSSASYNTLASITLTIGGVSGSFDTTTMIQDTIPDAFIFTPTLGARFNTSYTSNEIVVAGINSSSELIVTNGTYNINGGSFVSDLATVQNGDVIKVRVTSKSDFNLTNTVSLNIGGVVGAFSVTTLEKDTSPNNFIFDDILGAQFATIYTTKNVTIAGINSPSVISITTGLYSIDNGPFTNSPGLINNNQKVRVRVTSGNAFAAAVAATLTIDTKNEIFSVTTMVSDSVPDQFYFQRIDKASPNTDYLSNEITVYGTNASSPITITGGYYNINGGVYLNTPSNVSALQKIRVKLTTTSLLNTNNTAVLNIGGVVSNFTVKTAVLDTNIDAFYLIDQFNVALNSPIVSNPITVSGINSSVPVTVENGSYSINSGAYTSLPGTVLNGQKVTVKAMSSPDINSDTIVTLNIGGFIDTFTITTADTESDQFYFEDILNAQLNTSYVSNRCIISGLTASSSISIEGGTYSIDNLPYTNLPGVILNGQTVIVKTTSSPLHNTELGCVLFIGDVSGSFNVTTVLLDTVPTEFIFNDVVNCATNTYVSSGSVVITGITAPAPIVVTNGTYSINGGEYVNLPGDVINGQAIILRVASSPESSTKTSCTVNIGGKSDTFAVTTADIIPKPFYFADVVDAQLNSVVVSNACTVAGLTSFAAVSIVGGEYSIGIQPFTNSSGVISNLQQITVRVIASSQYETEKTATLTIGGVSATFGVTTTSVDIAPNPFFLVDVVNVTPNSPVLSNSIVVTNITAPSPISITGGTYSIADSIFVSEPGMVLNNQKVVVRLTSSADTFTTTTAILTIGNFSDSFSVTTNP